MYSKGWSTEIYQKYEQLKTDTGTYNNDDWVKKQIKRVKNFDKEEKVSTHRNQLLLSQVEKMPFDNITVIDFGGGLGLSYLPLKAAGYDNIKYKIIEVPKVVLEAKRIYENDENISFHESFNEIDTCPDIVYIRTSLQYAKDPLGILSKIADFKPKKIVLCDTSCGDIDTFLTYQLWGDEKIPYWFLNKEEIVKTLSKKGYAKKSEKVSQSIESNESFKDLKKYPKKHRIKTLINFIFEHEN